MKIDELEFVEDLIYYDGPLLSHYKNSNEDTWLYYWVSCNSECNKWLLIKLDSLQILQDFKDSKISLLELIRDHYKELFIQEIDSSLQVRKNIEIDYSDLDPSFLPSQDSYY